MATRAQNLVSTYGTGPVKGAAEVMAFMEAMRDAGLTDKEACVVGAWLGGAPAEHCPGYNPWDCTFRQTAPEACDSNLEVSTCTARLNKLDAELAGLINAKATGQQWRQTQNEERNVQEDVAKLKEKASAALTFDVLGLSVTPKMLAVGGLVALGALVVWRVAKAVA